MLVLTANIKRKMKEKTKVIIAIITIILLILLGTALIFYLNQPSQQEEKKTEEKEEQMNQKQNIKQTQEISIVGTRNDEITNNSMWCGTFQLIWNDLKNEVAKQDIVFTPQTQLAKNLNQGDFSTKDVSANSYYKKWGIPTIALKQEIEQAIQEKFNETSDILDLFDWANAGLEDYFLYTMLKKEFHFNQEFNDLGKDDFKDQSNISYFGTEGDTNDTSEALRQQVQVLYYDNANKFAILLETKEKEQVILVKNPEGSTFNEIEESIKNKRNSYAGSNTMQEGEKLKIPNIKVNELKEFKEVQGKPFKFANGNSYLIDKAIQTIQFELDKTGGKIKSEAGMMVMKSALIPKEEEKREFILDDTFAIFLQEEGKENPYFVAKISDMSLFQKEE